METKDSMTKFSSMLNSPYHNSNKVSVDFQRERSVESPYTSLESGQSSYASISQHGSYEFLKARAEKNSVMHDSKSRGKYFETFSNHLIIKLTCLSLPLSNFLFAVTEVMEKNLGSVIKKIIYIVNLN